MTSTVRGTVDHRSLNYFQTVPVRGQLEVHESGTQTGWRYLQCTDTPNELKVLLPPRTASLYAQLLQFETDELVKGSAASWKRIMEIRHLKDRMIRKCQRLASMGNPQSPTLSFRTIYAPPDFRLKEMERWMKDHGVRIGSSKVATAGYPAPPADMPPGTRIRASMRSTPPPPPPDRRDSYPEPAVTGGYDPSPTSSGRSSFIDQDVGQYGQPPLPPQDIRSQNSNLGAPVPDMYPGDLPPADPAPMPSHNSSFNDIYVNGNVPPPTKATSPEPLPHPFRFSQPNMVPFAAAMPVPDPAPQSYVDSDPNRPQLARRRSSLKNMNGNRPMSTFSNSKNVQWAMDKSQYEMAVHNVENAEHEHAQTRQLFETSLKSISDRRRQLAASLAELNAQMEKLEMEEQALHAFGRQLVEKGEAYNATVATVIKETKKVVDHYEPVNGQPMPLGQ